MYVHIIFRRRVIYCIYGSRNLTVEKVVTLYGNRAENGTKVHTEKKHYSL